MITITVVARNKEHWLLGIDILEVNATKLINSRKGEGNNWIVKRFQGKHSFREKPSSKLLWER